MKTTDTSIQKDLKRNEGLVLRSLIVGDRKEFVMTEQAIAKEIEDLLKKFRMLGEHHKETPYQKISKRILDKELEKILKEYTKLRAANKLKSEFTCSIEIFNHS